MCASAAGDFVSPVNRLRHLGTRLEQWGLLRARTVRCPTLLGTVLLLALCAAVVLGTIRSLHPFLAVTSREATDMLVVEGWAADSTLRAALAEFHRGGYRTLICTGGPVEKGEPLSDYGNFAEIGRATLARLGAPTDSLHAAPAPRVQRDRTYISAVALRAWLQRRGPTPAALNVLTTDAHARRTRLLFEAAFGPATKIGIIAIPHEHFDGSRWWRSSTGFRTTIDESIAYLYARFLFSVADDMKAP